MNKIYIFMFMLISSSSFISGANAFGKTITSDTTTLKYEFKDYQGKEQLALIKIANDDITASHNKMPKLEQLEDMFYKDIPNLANKIMLPYIREANKEFDEFNINTQSYSVNELGELNENFIIEIKCPKQMFKYKTYTIGKKIEHRLSIGSCASFVNTTKAYNKLIANLKELANESNDKMDDGSYISIITNDNGYKIKISASSKYNKLINNTKNLMIGYKEEYDNDVWFANKIHKELRANYKTAIDDLSTDLKEQLASLGDMLQDEKQTMFNKYYINLQKQNDNYIAYIDYAKLVNENPNGILEFNTNKNTTRDKLNYYLNFVQSIPYNQLKNRNIKSYAGFLPPFALLDSNKGDCDSKSVLFLRLVKQFVKHTPSVLILTPYHAFVGVAITPKTDDITYNIDGVKYVLAEVAGPSVMKLGDISQDTLQAIEANKIEYILKFNSK